MGGRLYSPAVVVVVVLYYCSNILYGGRWQTLRSGESARDGEVTAE